jgi:hypothetical protein
MRRYRVFRIRAAMLPTAIERDSKRLRKTLWYDCAARVLLRGPRSPLALLHPALARVQRGFETEALSAADRRRHVVDLLPFLRWLWRRRLRPPELRADDIALWIDALATRATPNRCFKAYTALRLFCRLRAGFDPSASKRMRRVLKGLRRRTHGPRPIPYDLALVHSLVATCEDSRAGRRDRAALLLLAAGLPAGLAVRLRWPQVTFADRGVELATPRGQFSLDLGSAPATCPVQALRALQAEAAGEGFVLCSLADPHKGITVLHLWEVVRARAARARVRGALPRRFRQQFLWRLGELGFDDTLFNAVAHFRFAETGRKYNCTPSPRSLAGRHRARRQRRTRNFVGAREQRGASGGAR